MTMILILQPSITSFATSHRKSSCDGIGGTIKREAAFKNQILIPEPFFLWTMKNMNGVAMVLPKMASLAMRKDMN